MGGVRHEDESLYLHEEKELDDAAACEWIMWWYAGMTEEEVYDLFKRSCEAYKDTDTEHVTWTSPEGIPSKLGPVDYASVSSLAADVAALQSDVTGIDGNLTTAASVAVVENTVTTAIDDLDELAEVEF